MVIGLSTGFPDGMEVAQANPACLAQHAGVGQMRRCTMRAGRDFVADFQVVAEISGRCQRIARRAFQARAAGRSAGMSHAMPSASDM